MGDAPAAGALGQVQQSVFDLPIYFDGNGKIDKGAASGRDWISDVRQRKARFEWTDATTMLHVASTLRGDAYEWWVNVCPTAMSAATFTTFSTTWAGFLKGFATEFNIKASGVDRGQADLGSQKPAETAAVYLNRVTSAMSQAGVTAIRQVDVTIPLDEPALLACNAATRAEIVLNLAWATTGARELIIRDLTGAVVKLCAKEGLSQPALRRKALDLEARDANMPMWDFMEAIKIADRNDAQSRGRTTTPRGAPQAARVHEVAAATTPDSSDAEEAAVDKVSAAKGKKIKKKPKKSNGAQLAAVDDAPEPRQERLRCTYCQKPGHAIDRCFTRMHNEKFPGGRGAQQHIAVDPGYLPEEDNWGAINTIAASGNTPRAW
jgi:hypothetical protein